MENNQVLNQVLTTADIIENEIKKLSDVLTYSDFIYFILTTKIDAKDIMNRIPEKFRTELVYTLLAGTMMNIKISDIPEEFHTNNVLYEFVSCYGRRIIQLKPEQITEEMYLAALMNDPLIMSNIPSEFKNYDVCLAAVRICGRILVLVPDDLKTHEMCLIATDTSALMIQFVPQNLRSYKLCKNVLKKSGELILFVPRDVITRELCEIAASNDERALEFIPSALITETLIIIALKFAHSSKIININRIMRLVSESMKNSDFYMKMISINGLWLECVPYNMRSDEICLAAISNCGDALEYVPESLLTQELCIVAIKNNASIFVINMIPAKYKTPEVCIETIKINCRIIKHINHENMTEDVHICAIRHNLFVYLQCVSLKHTIKYLACIKAI